MIAPAIIDRVGHAHLELIPTPKAHLQFEHLPPNSTVSVTCPPAKDIQATLDMAAHLLDLGHTVIPHLAARMVEGPEHVASIAAWFSEPWRHATCSSSAATPPSRTARTSTPPP